MGNKKFILNADDFGLSIENNQAILEGYSKGLLTSASLCANTTGYNDAINNVLSKCPDLGIAVHLNIMEGKALTDCNLLTDNDGNFNKGYSYLLLNRKNKKLLKQIENEFEAQIIKIKNDIENIDHIDSHVHTHAIPEIFEITCKLATKYNIKYVRTQFEKLYFIPKINKHLNFNYLLNLVKIALLQYFTKINRKTLEKYSLKSNDFILGVGYTGMMDSDTIRYGLISLKNISGIAEALIHPKKYFEPITNSHTKEFEITQDNILKDDITKMDFEITNYKYL